MANQKNNKAIHISLWIAQGLLVVMFIMAGAMKLSQPIETLTESLPWVTSVPNLLVKFIGLSEFLGALGLLVPSIFRFKPFLTVWAAIGLAVIMILAAIFHATRGEFSAIGMNMILMSISLFIAWGRSKKAPIQSKYK
ncbi:DoxX family protein [Aureibaculum algae]|uniref:DoxX family protein n=1 Tax=Aureibaculum algae TaxID=2584122 RepID=A0A5B7TRU0_9FLAO|nr:DoxX family protein [Aureibaculum algae]QCX37903.1 DoxX family protein [Aureibaculum algae]